MALELDGKRKTCLVIGEAEDILVGLPLIEKVKINKDRSLDSRHNRTGKTSYNNNKIIMMTTTKMITIIIIIMMITIIII